LKTGRATCSGLATNPHLSKDEEDLGDEFIVETMEKIVNLLAGNQRDGELNIRGTIRNWSIASSLARLSSTKTGIPDLDPAA
jgi:hypothetical protein